MAAETPPPFSTAARIFYTAPPEQSRVHRGLVYKTVAGIPLHADLYRPLELSNRPPIVILVHGPIPASINVAPTEWGQYVSWGEAIASSGMAALTLNHRMRWDNGFVAGTIADAEQDLSDAISFIRGRAGSFGIDEERIALMAFSAGGPLLARPIREHPDYIRCLVAFYALLGDPYPGSPDAGRFSAIDALGSGNVPPIFVAKAAKDMPFLNMAIDEFMKALSRVGADHEFIEHPAGFHGFDVNTDDETSRMIIRRALAFMKSRLG
jgi:acetyl esterase/lipase